MDVSAKSRERYHGRSLFRIPKHAVSIPFHAKRAWRETAHEILVSDRNCLEEVPTQLGKEIKAVYDPLGLFFLLPFGAF